MNVLIFEWLVGGGLLVDQEDIETGCQMLQQGRSMWSSLANDFQRAGHQVYTTLDSRITISETHRFDIRHVRSANELPKTLGNIAASVDAIILIAPESDKRLEQSHQWIEGFESKLLCPDLDFVKLTADKHATIRLLAEQGIATPEGALIDHVNAIPSRIPRPAVIKPNDGAGGECMRRIDSEIWSLQDLDLAAHSGPWRIEQWVTGIATSVSVICGRSESGCPVWKLLPPTEQVFAGSPGLHSGMSYRKARYPLPGKVARMAIEQAHRVVASLPATTGYIGIDMVINEQAWVLEVNPRLTTSYAWIRKLTPSNLAQVMLDLAG